MSTLLEEMQKALRLRRVWEALDERPDSYTYADLQHDLQEAEEDKLKDVEAS